MKQVLVGKDGKSLLKEPEFWDTARNVAIFWHDKEELAVRASVTGLSESFTTGRRHTEAAISFEVSEDTKMFHVGDHVALERDGKKFRGMITNMQMSTVEMSNHVRMDLKIHVLPDPLPEKEILPEDNVDISKELTGGN